MEWWTTGVSAALVIALWVFQSPRSYRRGLERNTRKVLREGRSALPQRTYGWR